MKIECIRNNLKRKKNYIEYKLFNLFPLIKSKTVEEVQIITVISLWYL